MFGISGLYAFARNTHPRCMPSQPTRTPGSIILALQASVILGALAAACATDSPTDPSSGGSRETFAVYGARFDGGGGGKQYFLRSDKNETRLYFETDPDLPPGTPIRVSGQPLNDGLRVLDYEVEQV